MSAAGRNVTSPADDLRALLARDLQPPYSIREQDDYLAVLGSWLLDNGAAVLALLDAAQALKGHMLLAQTPVRPLLFIDFVQALVSVSEPRP